MSLAYGETDRFCNRAVACEAHDDVPRSPADGETIGEVILRRYSRRDGHARRARGDRGGRPCSGPALLGRGGQGREPPDRSTFAEVEAGIDKTHHVADGYRAEILLRWGDPLFPTRPPSIRTQTAAAQSKQFGYNNDYVAFSRSTAAATRGLLCVNHEYTNEEVMFPEHGASARTRPASRR